MGRSGPAFYDDDETFAVYMASRQRPDNPNDAMEQPVLRELCGDLGGRRILDLGCGAAGFGVHALGAGARSYLGVDGSRNMVAAARRALAGSGGEVTQADLAAWAPPVAAFDLVVSSLALHYLADLEPVVAGAARALVPGGRFVCSVEHPVITSSDRGWEGGPRGSWIVDGYFDTGPRETAWLGGRVVKMHRTVEDYAALLLDAGFTLDALREACPRREHFTEVSEYERRRRIPLFLLLRGTLPG